MTKGIRAKDIRDFEKLVGKLDALISRIREYAPNAYIYATPNELNLMSEFDESCTSVVDQELHLVSTVSVTNLEAGDW